ncbi:MAG: YihY/virulence factor BrkB family protein, partial [Lutibacter sp.]|nr:YihY/virulence factor BrkB family protein [Lutibacter sp.]
FGFIASIFLMTNGVNAILGGFEYSYHVHEMRNIVKQYLISMAMAIGLSLILLMTAAMIVYFEIGIQNLTRQGLLDDTVFWIEKGRWLFLILLMFVSVSFLYAYGTKEVKLRSFFTPGAFLTTFLALVLFRTFAIYVEKFATYNELYGSIGTLLVLMLFVWLNAIILLLGFELNASISSLKKGFLSNPGEASSSKPRST